MAVRQDPDHQGDRDQPEVPPGQGEVAKPLRLWGLRVQARVPLGWPSRDTVQWAIRARTSSTERA